VAKSAVFGRRIHISGSISVDANVASAAEIDHVREFVALLVAELMKRGATFVVPVDAEKVRPGDARPICFDWLVWETIRNNLTRRPADAPGPLAVAVQHHKSEVQIPPQFIDLWDQMRLSDLVKIESAAHWDMNSKRMESQAKAGDILVTMGGGEGVLFLANLYHDAGKPIIPLNFKLCASNAGSLKLFELATTGNTAERFFQTSSSVDPQSWMHRLNFARADSSTKVGILIDLLESLRRPKAFGVRLLDPANPEFADVDEYFENVVKPVIEDELGYELVVIDGNSPYEHNRIDQEIFAKLHRSSIVIADITGERPNCFLELGYALGRGLPTMLLGKDGIKHPFDLATFSGHHWKPTGSTIDRRREFRKHWDAVKARPPVVPREPLVL